ncbi:MAG: ABC transporter permease [Vulcanimicrobiaceae bacterium]
MNDFITVYSAEIVRRMRSRIFVVGLLIGAVGLFGLIKLPQTIESAYATQAKKIIVAGDPALTAKAKTALQRSYTVVATIGPVTDPSAADLRAHGAKALIALNRRGDTLAVSAYAVDPGDIETSDLRRDLLPLNLEMATNLSASRVHSLVAIPVEIKTVASKFGTAAQSDSAHVIAYLLLFLLYVLIMMNSQIIMSSVAEEKTSRIAELLIASVNPSSLLAGKIAASATLASIQLFVWVLMTFLAAGSSGGSALTSANSGDSFQFSPADMSQGLLLGFVIFFVLAFLQTVTLFAAVASLVNRTEDLGSVAGPMMVPVIAAFFIAMMGLRIPDSPLVVASSFIPVLSPFVMFTRLVVSTVPAWQISLSLAINLLAIWGIAILGAKLYRIGMLLYGRPPKLTQIWTAMRAQ